MSIVYTSGIIDSKLNNLHTYSTGETKVGIWIDGKPLYRKVLQGTKVSGTNLILTIPDAEEITFLYTKLNQNSAHSYVLPWYEAAEIYGRVEIKNNAILITSGTSTYSNGTIMCIAEYTKTTD